MASTNSNVNIVSFRVSIEERELLEKAARDLGKTRNEVAKELMQLSLEVHFNDWLKAEMDKNKIQEQFLQKIRTKSKRS
jgi:predicted DNA-binding protein